MSKRLILASSSPVKNIVMRKTGLSFISISPDIDENQFDDLSVDRRVVEIANAKSNKLAGIAEYKKDLIIAADTLTISDMDEKTHSKYKNLDDQYQAALELSGQKLKIYTGVSICNNSEQIFSDVSYTEVRYQKFTKQDIKRLAKDDLPKRRSSPLGMFTDAIGFTLVKSVEGSYTGAIGLPTELIYPTLRQVGFL